ncbi:MAG: flavodoxin family protein [Thermoprotei archaeon]|nr:MAG: flavodoxin family protein [Thermoprotei archaeon]RLF19550.1 MAG: flavodoxin family protein [Thermoprotei archaeon]
MVRILGINGSPRKYGNTFKLLKIALEFAKKEGAEVRLVNLYDYDIRPCLGCLCDEQTACRYPCVIEDDMRELYDLILKSDGLIIATPVYWFSPSGVVKTFIDRLTVFENMIYIDGYSWAEGKVAGIIAVGNDSGVIQVISTLYATLVSMGFAIPPWALAYFNKQGDVLKDINVVMDAANVGRVVTIMAKAIKDVRRWYDSTISNDELKRVITRVKEEAERNKLKQTPEREQLISLAITLKGTQKGGFNKS